MRISDRAFGFILILFISGMVVSIVYTLLTDQQIVEKQRELVSATHFVELWTQSNISLVPSRKPFIVVESDCVVLFSHSGLQCLNTLTGKTRWQTSIRPFSNELASNNRFVFASSPRRSENCKEFTPMCDSINVTAYAVASGSEAWNNTYFGMGVVSQMHADETNLIITGGGGHGTYRSTLIVDTITGELIDYEELELTLPPPDSVPTFANERGRVTSNTAVEANIVYFFTDDTTLWALDENAEVRATAVFSPGQTRDTIQLAVQDGKVFVYFNNSQQLFALNLSD